MMEASTNAYSEQLDEQLRTLRDKEKQHMMSELESTPDGSKPSRLSELATQSERKIELAEKLAESAKKNVLAAKTKNESSFAELQDEAKAVREQLKSGKYTDPGVAGMSREDAAKTLGAQLLSYRRKEEELAQGFELLTEDVPSNLEAMTESLGKAGELADMSLCRRTKESPSWKS